MRLSSSAVFYWLFAIKPSNSFVVNSHYLSNTLIQTQLNLAKGQNGQGKKRTQRQGKRRFAQDVEPLVDFLPPAPQQQRLHPTEKIETNIISSSRSRSKNMVQSGKSIEDLENIMSKRWGTSGDKWSVDFKEWEVVDDGGNETKDNKHMRTSLSSGRKVRSKPVLDPWEKEERQKKFSEKKKQENRNEISSTNASAFQSARDRQDTVLNRVKRNQERLRSKKKAISEKLDFYDEDDEGYEPSLSFYNEDDEELEAEAEDFYNNIISPTPVGGAGSSKSRATDQGAFFFSPDPATSFASNETEN